MAHTAMKEILNIPVMVILRSQVGICQKGDNLIQGVWGHVPPGNFGKK